MATLTPAAADDKACSNENLRLRFAFPGEASDVMENYFQRDAKHANLSRKLKLYDRFRPWIPIPVRQLLQRGRNRAIETTDDWFLPLAFTQDLRSAASQNHDQPLIHPWSDNHEMAVCLTHDVETQTGVGLVDRLAKLEESLGYRSAWIFIPHKYKIDPGLITDLQERGHEICVHGYNHDGRLFESKRTFTRRSQLISSPPRPQTINHAASFDARSSCKNDESGPTGYLIIFKYVAFPPRVQKSLRLYLVTSHSIHDFMVSQ
jgi:hypothetical protein